MAQFVGKPLPDFSVKPLKGGELGAKTSLKGLAAGRPLVRSRRVLSKTRGALRLARFRLERSPTSDAETHRFSTFTTEDEEAAAPARSRWRSGSARTGRLVVSRAFV